MPGKNGTISKGMYMRERKRLYEPGTRIKLSVLNLLHPPSATPPPHSPLKREQDHLWKKIYILVCFLEIKTDPLDFPSY